MFQGTMTKWPVQKLAQGTTQKLLQHHDATGIYNTLFDWIILETGSAYKNAIIEKMEFYCIPISLMMTLNT